MLPINLCPNAKLDRIHRCAAPPHSRLFMSCMEKGPSCTKPAKRCRARIEPASICPQELPPKRTRMTDAVMANGAEPVHEIDEDLHSRQVRAWTGAGAGACRRRGLLSLAPGGRGGASRTHQALQGSGTGLLAA